MAGRKFLRIDCPGSSYNKTPPNWRCYKKIRRAMMKAIDVAVTEQMSVQIYDDEVGLVLASIRLGTDTRWPSSPSVIIKKTAPIRFQTLWEEEVLT